MTAAVFPQRTGSDWRAFATDIQWPRGIVSDGAQVPAADGKTQRLISPHDGGSFATAPWGSIVDLDLAVQAARTAFDEGPWPKMDPAERKRILLAWADLIEKHRDELAVTLTCEMGKPVSQSWNIELRAVLNTYRWYAESADKTLDEIATTPENALALITREPVGVVGVITPWNFPLTLAAWKIAPALAAGCTVVQKPSELTPLSALRMAELALEAGIPPGVLNVVPGDGFIIGRRLGEHPQVDALAFTGSTEVGRRYLEYSASSNLKRTWLELGGKSANIILPDAPDLGEAIATAAWGITFNTGQMCTAPSRLVVHTDIADEVIAGVASAVGSYQPGDPFDPKTTFGPLASSARAADVRNHIDTARAEGAYLFLDVEDEAPTAELSGGSYIGPKIFTNVTPGSSLATQEVFGPVLAIQIARDDDEAIRIANDSDYGLAAGLWTADASKAHRLSRRIRAGTVWVNCYEEGDINVPFGGYKLSGNGRDKSHHAIDKYTELKTTYLRL